MTDELSEERHENVLKSLNDLHTKIDELDKTVRNGLSAQVTSNNTHIKMQWYFLGGILIGMIALVGRIVYAAVGQ